MRWALGVVSIGFVLASFGAIAGLEQDAARGGTGCRWAWRVERDARGPYLSDVAAVSASEAWAVGWSGPDARRRPVILRWKGSRWAVSFSGASAGALHAVDASGPDDVWAVGESAGRELVLRWDGTGWRRIAVQHQPVWNAISAVAVVDRADVWLGRRNLGGTEADVAPTFEHWDGRRWSAWHDASLAVWDFSVLSASDIWAVGEYGSPFIAGIDGAALRWNGTRWTEVRVASLDDVDAIASVSARSGTDAWAVGTTIQRWNGRSWRIHSRRALDGVTVADRGRVHAVGSVRRAGVERPAVAQWDGRRWTQRTLPARGGLRSVERAPRAGLVAVGGSRGETLPTRTLIARFSCR